MCVLSRYIGSRWEKIQVFTELIKNFDFVNVLKEDEAKKDLIKKIAEGMYNAALASEGKISSRSARAFLNEL